MKVMEWQATDQFGNLYIGESHATDLESLRPDVKSLIGELRERVGDAFDLTVDFGYAEICGPDPGKVSHVLRVPWLSSAPRDGAVSAVKEIVADLGLEAVNVQTT